MDVATAEYGFAEQQGPDYIEFVVTPPPLRASLKTYFFLMHLTTAFVLALVLSFAVGFFLEAGWHIIAIVFFGGGWLLYRRFSKQAKDKQWMLATTRIRVQGAGIRLLRDDQDTLFERKHISDIWVEDPSSGDSRIVVSVSSTAIAGGGAAGAVTAFGLAANEWGKQVGGMVGDAMARQALERAASIHLQYGSQDVTLLAALPRQVALKLADRIVSTFTVTA